MAITAVNALKRIMKDLRSFCIWGPHTPHLSFVYVHLMCSYWHDDMFYFVQISYLLVSHQLIQLLVREELLSSLL